MKKLLLALLIMPLCSFGQLSLRPSIGAGYGTISEKGFLISHKKSATFIQNAGLSAVYGFNDWFVSAGIGYLTTGANNELGSLQVSPPHEPLVYWNNVRIIERYQHITIPVAIGREISMQKFSLLPEVGLDLSYNLPNKSKMRSDEYPNADFRENERFSYDYKRWSVFASLGVTASYKLSNRLSIFCGPSYKYMVTSIIKYKTNTLTGASISQNHHAMLLNAGMYVRLSK